MAWNIFISYAHEDHSRTELLVRSLEAEGFSPFLDRKLAPGSEWRDEISAGLEVVPCILVIWSKSSVVSRHVRGEAAIGLEREVLVPIVIDLDVKPPIPFAEVQTPYIDLPNTDVDWRLVVNRIRTLVNTARAKGWQHSATPLANILQDTRTSYEAQIAAIIDPLRRVASSPDLVQKIVDESLHKVHAAMLRDDLFSIAVVGRMKVGKSTLLNALVGPADGQSVAPLPTEDLPCTATLIKLRHANVPYCRPYAWDHFHNTIEKAMRDWEFTDFHERARIYQNGTSTNIFNSIAEFEIGWPSSLLNAGVSLVDTPGTSENPKRTELTRTAIANFDAAIVVYRSDVLAGTDEIEFAEDVTARVGKVFTVVNLRDGTTVPQKSVFENVLRERLHLDQSRTLLDQDVFSCNLQKALTASWKQGNRLSDDSEFSQFQTRLAEFLISGRYRAHLLKAVREIKPLGESLSSTTSSLLGGVLADATKVREAIADCRKLLATMERKKGNIETLFTTACASAESAAWLSFEAKVGDMVKIMPARIDSLDLGIRSFSDKLAASTLKNEKWVNGVAEKIRVIVRNELENWSTAESDAEGLAHDLKPIVDQLESALKAQAEDIADVVQHMRARIASVSPNESTEGKMIDDTEMILSTVFSSILFGPLGVVGIGGWRGVAGAVGGTVAAGFGLGLTVTILNVAFPPTLIATAIVAVGTLAGAAFGATHKLEQRLKEKAWDSIKPTVQAMVENQDVQKQLKSAIRDWFSDMQARAADGLAKMIKIENDLLARQEALTQQNENKDKLIERLAQHKAAIDEALKQTRSLETELQRTVRTPRSW